MSDVRISGTRGPRIPSTIPMGAINDLKAVMDYGVKFLSFFNQNPALRSTQKPLLFLRATSSSYKIVESSNEANIILYVKAYDVADKVSSETARHILAFRGYSSVHVINRIEIIPPNYEAAPVPQVTDETLGFVEQAVIEINRGSFHSVYSELTGPRLITKTVGNAGWFQEAGQWKEAHSNGDQVLTILPSGSISILRLNPGDMVELSTRFNRLVYIFRDGEEKSPAPVTQPPQPASYAPVAFAPTAFHDVQPSTEEKIRKSNVSVLMKSALTLGDAKYICAKVDPDNGKVETVKEREEANIVFVFSAYPLDMSALPVNTRPLVRPAIELVSKCYLDVTIMDKLEGLLETAIRLNNALKNSFISALALSLRSSREALPEDRMQSLKAQIDALIAKGIERFQWQK